MKTDGGFKADYQISKKIMTAINGGTRMLSSDYAYIQNP